MNIEAEKISLIRMLTEAKSEDVIKRVKGVLMEMEPDWWDALSGEQQESLEKGLKESEQGDLIGHETVMKKYRK